MSDTFQPRTRPTCPDCREEMEAGLIIDHGHGYFAQSTWVPGPAEKSFWSGLRIRGRQKFPTTTFRCGRCGLLRSYAFTPPGPRG